MLKKVLVGVAALLLIVLVGGYLMVRSAVPDESVRPRLAAVLSDALGQPVQIERAHVMFSPKIGIELTGVAIGEPARISIDALRVATGLWPLFSKRIEGAEIVVDGGQVGLPLPPLGGRGGSTPDSPPPAGGDASSDGFTIVSVDTIAIRNFTVTSGDRTLKVDLETSLAGDTLKVGKLMAQADLSGVDVASLLAYAGSPGAMTGTLSGTIDLAGSGADAAQTMKTMKGDDPLDRAQSVNARMAFGWSPDVVLDITTDDSHVDPVGAVTLLSDVASASYPSCCFAL